MIQCIRSSSWRGYMLMKVWHDLPEIGFVKAPWDDKDSVRMFVNVAAEHIVTYSKWGEQERDRMEIFLGSHHLLLIMKHKWSNTLWLCLFHSAVCRLVRKTHCLQCEQSKENDWCRGDHSQWWRGQQSIPSTFYIDQWHSNLAPEIHFPAEFSSNPDQTHQDVIF